MPRSSSASSGRGRVHPLDALIGNRVRARRVAIGMSQEALAGAQQIQKYEKGCNRIGAGQLAQIAACLGVPAAFFFEFLPGQPAATEGGRGPLAEGPLSVDGLTLARAFARIKSAALRRRIIMLAEEMSNARSPSLTRQGSS